MEKENADRMTDRWNIWEEPFKSACALMIYQLSDQTLSFSRDLIRWDLKCNLFSSSLLIPGDQMPDSESQLDQILLL